MEFPTGAGQLSTTSASPFDGQSANVP
jgi:hypothetical protein